MNEAEPQRLGVEAPRRRDAGKRARKGRCEGRKTYGFYEGESAVLERAKALRAEGLGFDRIAARMNEEWIPTRTGRRGMESLSNRILSGGR